MPQLNPSPWFFIFLFSWVIFLAFMPLKLSNHIYPSDPSSKSHKSLNRSWLWPWP